MLCASCGFLLVFWGLIERNDINVMRWQLDDSTVIVIELYVITCTPHYELKLTRQVNCIDIKQLTSVALMAVAFLKFIFIFFYCRSFQFLCQTSSTPSPCAWFLLGCQSSSSVSAALWLACANPVVWLQTWTWSSSTVLLIHLIQSLFKTGHLENLTSAAPVN